MTPKFMFEGIYTPPVTPLLPDGRLNKPALADHIERSIAAAVHGVHGVIFGGFIGEDYAQTVDKRLSLAEFKQSCLKGRQLVGTRAMGTDKSIALAKGARAMGRMR